MTRPDGSDERERARGLIAALPPSADPALTWRGLDLRPAAEHLLYTALRQPAADARAPSLARSLVRLARALRPQFRGEFGRREVAVFVTQPVHVALARRVEAELRRRGIAAVFVDAETRAGRSAIDGCELRLADMLRPHDAVSLAAHAVAVAARLRTLPDPWHTDSEGTRLLGVLQRGIPLVALEVARVDALLARLEPELVACFSESGLLARTVPAAAHGRGITAVDLPHAEAADPSGTAGAGYDGFAVYGPRSRQTLELAGVPAARIVEVGPLRYDGLIAHGATQPRTDPRTVLFASQPSDPRRPAIHPDVKRGALAAALAATHAVAPAELVVLPHPTEPPGEAESFLDELADTPAARVERERELHDLLPRAWLLVTASSQSVFEAVVSGVPAMTVNPTDRPDPVSFAADGIAIGVRTPDEAAAAASALVGPGAREAVVAGAREALGDRIGPLDGRAAERTAAWLASLVGVRPAGG